MRTETLALLVVGLTGGMAFAKDAPAPATPVPAAGQPERRELWVPVDQLKTILAKNPNAVLLSREQYETLLRDSGLERKVLPAPPRTAAFSSAKYTARSEGRVLAITAEFTVNVLADEWVQVPLVGQGLTLGELRVDGEAALVATQDATTLLLRGRGEHRVSVEYTAPITREPGRSRIAFKFPAAATGSLSIDLPSGTEVESSQPLRVTKSETATNVVMALASSAPVADLAWRANVSAALAVEPVVEERIAYLIDAEKVRAEFTCTFTTKLGNLPARSVINLPAGAKLIEVVGSEVAKWALDGDRLLIDWLGGERKETSVRVSVEQPSLAGAASATATLAVIAFEGARREQGWFGLLAEEGVSVKDVVTDAEPSQVAGAVQTNFRVISAYRFARRPAAPKVTIEKVAPRFTADLDTLVEFKTDAIFAERTITVHEEQGRTFEIAVTLPQGEELLTVRDGETEPDWRVEGGKIKIRWSDSGKKAHAFTLRTRAEPEGWTQPAADGISWTLGDAKIDGVATVTGYIALKADESFRLEAAPSDTLERRDGRTTPVRGDYAWFRRQDFTLAVKVAKRPGEVLAVLTGYALPLEGVLDLHGQLHFTFLHSGQRSVRVHVPAVLAQNFYFDGPQIAERNLAGDIWTIVFQKELTGTYDLSIAAQVPVVRQAETTKFQIDVPLIAVPDAQRSSGVWSVEANTETEITFTAKGMNELDSLLAPPLPGYTPRHRVIGVFGWLGQQYALTLSGVRHESADVISSVVDRLDLETVVSTSGVERSQAKYQLRTAGAQYLDVALPPGSRLLSLTVDDTLVKPVGERADHVRVQLPAKQDTSAAIVVSVLYETPKDGWSGRGSYNARAPKLAKGIPILRTSWHLHLPDGYEYTGFDSNLPVSRDSGEPLLIPELARKSATNLWRIIYNPIKSQSGGSGINDPQVSPNAPAAAFRDMTSNPSAVLLQEADRFSQEGRYDLAFKRYEQVLQLDPTNVAAGQGKEKLAAAMNDGVTAGYNEARARAMKELAKAWVRPVRRFNQEGDEAVSAPALRAIQQKLDQTIIPRLEFRETTVREAVDYLAKVSGVKIMIKVEGSQVEGPGSQRITVSLTNIPVGEAIRYVTSLGNLKFKIEPDGVAIVPLTANTDSVVTKEWAVAAGFLTMPDGTKADLMEWLKSIGMQFGPGASAVYVAGSSKLIIRNAQEQLDLLDAFIESAGESGKLSPNAASEGVLWGNAGVVGLLPMKIELPKDGREIAVEGLYAAERVEFQFEDWWNRARRLWIWFVAGGIACFMIGRQRPWWRMCWAMLVLSFYPVVVSAGATAICNALLGGWLTAFVLLRIAAWMSFAKNREEVLA